MALNKKNSKRFWKTLDKLKDKNHDDVFIKSIPTYKWKQTFEGILRNKTEPVYPEDCLDEGPLDFPITINELQNASYILRSGKASGIDAISNEMLQCILKLKPSILYRLFNSILKYNGETPNWYTSILALIHKKGSKSNTLNYRGISLLSCVSKLFTAILNTRLSNYVKEKNIIAMEQLGFMPGNRTSDAHILIHNIIQKYCHKENKRIYSCFVDFKKAFDSIPRGVLFQKLKSYGITGKFFNVLKTMYSHDSTRIKIGDELSDIIYPNQGVKQGCILSPLLFNIFLSDLPKTLNTMENYAPIIGNTTKLNCIIWADDVIILSESEKGLNNMLERLATYTEENSMEINIEKTKGMIFNKTGKFLRRNFKYKNGNIETVREYKYLGFILIPSGSISHGLNDLKARASRALAHLRNMTGEYFRKETLVTIKLFNTIVRPILLYMADFWGCLKTPKNNPIEILQNKFLKQLLGVQIQTTNIGVLLETGEIPLSIHAKKLCIKNWSRIAKKRCNSLVQMSYQDAVKENLLWQQRICDDFFTIGLGNIFLAVNNIKHVENIYFQRATDLFHQTALAEIKSDKSKLRTYGLLKTDVGYENYLSEITSINDRTMLTKFRLSNHTLMIEKGRHLGINKYKRHCQFCPDHVEDEFHFLIICKNFKTHREELFLKANCAISGFAHFDQKNKFIKLLTHKKIVKEAARYLNNTLCIREFLQKMPKNNS